MLTGLSINLYKLIIWQLRFLEEQKVLVYKLEKFTKLFKKMFIVAITGGIATGKSTVSKVFEENGIPVVDADKIARESK